MEKGRLSNNMGDIVITPDVIATYAGTQACECFGVVGMAALSVKDGIVRMLKRESMARGINVTIVDNVISLDFHIIVAYGINIISVTQNLIENVKYKVETFTGMKVDRINVYVEGVKVID